MSIEAAFDGGHISSDGGSLLLAEVERHTGVLARLAACFRDHRDPDLIEHTVPERIAQRVYGIALGYEDLNDHDRLRFDSPGAGARGEPLWAGPPARCARRARTPRAHR